MTNRRMALAALSAAAICMAAALWNPQIQTINFEGQTVRYRIAGKGSPAVILEAGLGLGLDSFDPVFDSIAKIARVFAYDRPGYGGSSATPRTRTFSQVVDDLRAVLQATGVTPPYVLAGHSLGGQYMLAYARRYPNEVVAIVLIDTPHPNMYQQLRTMGRDPMLSDKQYWNMPATMQHEYEAAMRETSTAHVGTIPLIVITSGAVQHGEYGPLANATQQQLSQLSARGKRVVAETSSHMVMRDDPELVVQCIAEAVSMSRDLWSGPDS